MRHFPEQAVRFCKGIFAMKVLSDEQIVQFAEQGYLVVSGLIAKEVVDSARSELELELIEGKTAFFGTNVANSCYNQAICSAAAILGDDPAIALEFPVKSAFAINTLPTEGKWVWPNPHIDHAIEKDGHKVFPRPFRLASMLYLSDISVGGGGTVVWPGSHRQIERLALSDPEHYEMMWVLNRELAKAGLASPVELTAKAGDILFYHYLCAHAGSKNTTSQPRLALNKKW